MEPRKNLISEPPVRLVLLILLIPLMISLFGCNNANNPMQPISSSDNLALSNISENNLSGNTNGVLIINEAKVMIKDMKIELEKAGGEGEDENIKVGPFVIDLKPNSSVTFITSSVIPAGNYEKVKFHIHKLGQEDVVIDPDFSDANGRYSVVVRGIYNGVEFTYKSKITANQKLNLQKVLIISPLRLSNITFYANPILWFFDNNGNVLDPTLESNRVLIDDNIRDNIKHNLRIFVDEDRDGRPDD